MCSVGYSTLTMQKLSSNGAWSVLPTRSVGIRFLSSWSIVAIALLSIILRRITAIVCDLLGNGLWLLYTSQVMFLWWLLSPCEYYSCLWPNILIRIGKFVCWLVAPVLHGKLRRVLRSSAYLLCWLGSEESSSFLGSCLSRRDTWLILPVVICLSQRLSHACLSTSLIKVKPRMAH